MGVKSDKYICMYLVLGHDTQNKAQRNNKIKVPSSDPSTKTETGRKSCETYIDFLDKQQIGYKSFSRTLELLDASRFFRFEHLFFA
ncbi:hypothetical protein V6N13_005638 [Hibiscus sabdariffa]